MTSHKDDDKFPESVEGASPATTMSWLRFEEISDIAASGQPLTQKEREEYEQGQATIRATLQPALEKAMQPVKAQMRTALRKVRTPELDELLNSLRSKQSEVNSIVASTSKARPTTDLAGMTGAKEQDHPLDALVSLTETQTNAINEMANVIATSGNSQRNFNLLMLLLTVLACIFTAGQLIVAMRT